MKKVSIITPTLPRRSSLLLSKCIPSVQAQDYEGEIEHIIVSDGRNVEIGMSLILSESAGIRRPVPIIYSEMPDRPAGSPPYGAHTRKHALQYATGDYIGYLDDDDAYRPGHVAALAKALDDNPECGFAYSYMVFHHNNGNESRSGLQGPGQFYGTCGTPTIMHRREILDIHSWGDPDPYEDYRLVQGWVKAGIKYIQVEADTVDVWPSRERGY